MKEATEITLAALALAATSVGAIIYIAKWAINELSKDIKAHTKAAIEQKNASIKAARASDRATKASGEVLLFMRKLNGKLPKLVEEKQKQAIREN